MRVIFLFIFVFIFVYCELNVVRGKSLEKNKFKSKFDKYVEEERVFTYDNPERVLHFPFGETVQFVSAPEATTMGGIIKEGKVGNDEQVEPSLEQTKKQQNINNNNNIHSNHNHNHNHNHKLNNYNNNNHQNDNRFRNTQKSSKLFQFDVMQAFSFKEAKPENVVHTSGHGYIPGVPKTENSYQPKIEL